EGCANGRLVRWGCERAARAGGALQHGRGPLPGASAVLERRTPVLRAVELGVPDRNPAIALARAFQRARFAIHTVVKARRFDEARVPPAVEHDGGDVPLGPEAMGAE